MKEGRIQGTLQLAQEWAQGSVVQLWQRTYASHFLLGSKVPQSWEEWNSSRVSLSPFPKEVIWQYVTPSSLEKEMATHSSILAWKISQREEPGGL